MALKIKCVHYNTVHLSTNLDLQLFSDDLNVLIDNGYKVTIDISATNTLAQELLRGSATVLPPQRYSFGDYEPLASYDVGSSTGSETSPSWLQSSSHQPAPKMKYYCREHQPRTSTDATTESADI